MKNFVSLASLIPASPRRTFPASTDMSAKHPDWDWALLEQSGEISSRPLAHNRFGADWKFLAHFYRTGEKVRFEVETGADEPLLTSILSRALSLNAGLLAVHSESRNFIRPD